MIKLRIELIGDKEVKKRLSALPEELRNAVKAKLRVIADAVVAKAVENVSGILLERKSGQLADSIRARVEVSGRTTSVSIGPTPATEKAKALEFGGKSNYPILPINKNFLHFFWEKPGVFVFLKAVNHPPARAHEYMKQTLNEMQGEITSGIGEALAEVLELV